VILRGAGRAFCAGYDLKQDAEEGTMDAAEWHRELDRDTRRLLRILELPKPVIASVHSYCLAGGMDLMLACDLALAAEDAIFGYVDIRFGSGIVSMFLPWIVGVRAAKELVFTGEDRFPATEAHRIGLVNRVVSRDELDDATLALADEIARNEPFVVRTMKASINRVWQLAGLRAALDANTELDVMIETANLPARDEFRRITQEEGLKAAIAWRDARYRGEG
jgi:enoyl-CoA hydratase